MDVCACINECIHFGMDVARHKSLYAYVCMYSVDMYACMYICMHVYKVYSYITVHLF